MLLRRLVFLIFTGVFAQGLILAQSEQDCPNAIPVCQSSYTQTNSYSGTGSIPNEINSNISCLSQGEKNDVWYTFTVTTSGNLNFLITPNNFSDDYDWAIYNLTNAGCTDIYNNQALQVSCNYSATSGSTGANGGSSLNSQDASGTPFNALIPVVAGETYVVNVSNFSSTQFGYTLDFGNSTAGIYDNVPPQLLTIQQPACGDSLVTFNFSENILCSSLQVSDFTLVGPSVAHSVIAATGNACMGGADYDNTVTLTVSPAMTDTGNYYLIVVDSIVDICNNTTGITSDTLTFSITGINVLAISSADTLCQGQSAVLTASGASTYNWVPASGLSSATGSPVSTNSDTSITYLVTGTQNGCSDTASVEITVNPLPVVIVDPSNVVMCIGNAVPLIASGANSYSWSPATGLSASAGDTVTATPSSTITYTVTGTGSNGCTDTASATIIVDTGIIVTIVPDSAFICNGDSALLAANGSVDYSWSPAAALSSATGDSVFAHPSLTTTFYVTGNSFGCTGTDSVVVTVYPIPVVDINPAAPVICDGDSVSLAASGATSYLWQPPLGLSDTSGSSVFAFPGDTTLYYVAGNSNGCIDSATVLVIVNPMPAASAGSDTGFCTGGTAVIGSPSVPGLSYSWSPATGLSNKDSSFTSVSLSNNTNVITVNPYVISVTENNCTSWDTAMVSVYPNPVAVCDVFPKETGEFSPIVSFTSQSINGAICTWYFGEDTVNGCSASYTYPDTGTYPVRLEVYSEYGCYDETSCNAVIRPEFIFYIPNAFSPDGDEMNDDFSGEGVYIKTFLMRIFDRWGNLIFQTDNASNRWDGKVKNARAPQDVYVYKIEITDIMDKKHKYLGRVTLVR